MDSFKGVILIPVYRHGKACIKVVESLAEYCRQTGVKVILVDDGNAEETKHCLEEIKAANEDFVNLVVLKKNSGKGGAVKAGLKFAKENGFTHALQLDADGQHDTQRCAFFFEKARLSPEKMICGYPEYDESAPGHRKNGRKFANTWCALVTWQSGIVDSLCGFRVYPVDAVYGFLENHRLDLRMGFDIDVLVRLIWAGLEYEFYSVKVTYPEDGFSNFRMVRDNARISWVFTKLCCGMFLRLPKLVWRKIHGK